MSVRHEIALPPDGPAAVVSAPAGRRSKGRRPVVEDRIEAVTKIVPTLDFPHGRSNADAVRMGFAKVSVARVRWLETFDARAAQFEAHVARREREAAEREGQS